MVNIEEMQERITFLEKEIIDFSGYKVILKHCRQQERTGITDFIR